MSSLKTILAGATCATAMLAATNTQANMLTSAGFEDGPAAWNLIEAEVQPWADKAKTGDNTIFIKTFLSNTSVLQTVDVTEGTSYELGVNLQYEARVSTITDLAGKLVINWYADDQLLSTSEAALTTPAATDVYDFYSLSAAAPATANKAAVGVTFNHSGTQVFGGQLSIFGDDFSFDSVIVPEPASLALMGLAGLTLITRRRK